METNLKGERDGEGSTTPHSPLLPGSTPAMNASTFLSATSKCII